MNIVKNFSLTRHFMPTISLSMKLVRTVLSVLLCLGFFLPVLVNADPSPTNKIGLRIARVFLAKENVFDNTTEAGTNRYEYLNQPLKIDDEIRYAWFGTNLSATNTVSPTIGNGYLKVYLKDDSNEANLIKNTGSSPLPIREISPRLLAGRNKILLVLVENPNGTSEPLTKVELSFDYAPDTLPPSITVLSPAPGSVFASGITRDFSLKLNNFYLEKADSKTLNKGKLEVYLNQISSDTLLNTITSSVDREQFSEVSFNSAGIDKIQTAPDSTTSKLIFVLKNSNGNEIVSARKELPIITNYGGTQDLGLPSLKIKNPVNNAEITTLTKIQLEVKNFELLSGIDISNQKSNAGYIQVRINDKLVVENTNKTEFTLSDFGLNTYSGVITLKLDLVNQQFAFLQPAASSTISVSLQKMITTSAANNVTVSTSTWRYVILVATIVLILGSIAVLIIKG